MRTAGRYEVRLVLSKGTTPLYLAFDPLTGRTVIIRALSHTLAGDAARRGRFFDSATSAAHLSSPRIAPILDLGDERGIPFVVMELPAGASLRSIMDQPHPRSVGFRVDVIRQLCDALVHAHAHGVSQLGLRPTGIFVTDEGCVMVVPFGTVPIHGARGTVGALNLDEVAYLAPELIEGCVADRRAEVFSLGVIAYELMAGRRPFRATNIPAMLHDLVNERPDPSALEKSPYSPALEATILKAMARDPQDRFADAGTLLVAIEDAISQSRPAGLAADPDTPAVPAPRPAAAATPKASPRQARTEVLRAEALSWVADGRIDRAQALAEKIEVEEPGDPRNALLRAYLREEGATEALLTTAQRQFALGNLREARAAAAEALTLDPWRARARSLLCQLDRMLVESKR